MSKNTFLVLMLVVIIVLALLASARTLAFTALFFNLVLLMGESHMFDGWDPDAESKQADANKKDEKDSQESTQENAPESAQEKIHPTCMGAYGPYYEQWYAFNASYSAYDAPKLAVGVSAAERDNSVDTANIMLAQQRARDRKCMDGIVSRSADYYRYHYVAELEDSENTPWWSRHEY